ncbi:flagellar hook-basal body protein [bacterium]|nr:flagellar hook-basal body protein [bacterium]
MILRGLEAASNGMLALIDMNDNLANNIANVNTTGYKKSCLTFKDIIEADVYNRKGNLVEGENKYIGQVSLGSETLQLTHDFSQGCLNQTDAPLDLAIEGDGFFKVQDADGKISYTRNGSFTEDSRGFLITKEGDYVLDTENRRINLAPEEFVLRSDRKIVVGEDGTIELNSGGARFDMQKIGIFDFSNKDDLFEIGNARFIPKTPAINPELRSEKYSIQQGYIELSNTNIIKEMINSINTTRNYESLGKYVKENSSLLSTAITLGRIRQ